MDELLALHNQVVAQSALGLARDRLAALMIEGIEEIERECGCG